LRLLLEFVYAKLITSLTNHALTMVKQNPSFDLRALLGSTDLSRDLFDSEPTVYRGCFLTGGVEPFFPLSQHVRDAASRVLQGLGNNAEDLVFAMILSDAKIITLVQPSHHSYRIKNVDLQLFVSFVYRQPGLLKDELWLPFCFPRFNASGFLHCYTNCLDMQTKTVLVLVSPDPTQFAEYRRVTALILRPKLGLQSYQVESVLEILDSQTSDQNAEGRGMDVQWRRSDFDEDSCDEDYEMIPRMHDGNELGLLREIQSAAACSSAGVYIRDLIGSIGIEHFVFRLGVCIDNAPDCKFLQCISSKEAVIGLTERRLWSTYQKLSLRLRLGSGATEAVFDAFAMLLQDANREQTLESAPGIGKDCPASGLLESPPNLEVVSYLKEGDWTFLAMNGQGSEDFEL
jgi:hypothetical protein